MKNYICTAALVAAIATMGISPAKADPIGFGGQASRDLQAPSDIAPMAYIKFSLGGKQQRPGQRFQSGLRLQMRNIPAQSRYLDAKLDLMDLSFRGTDFSSLSFNDVPLMAVNDPFNADGGDAGPRPMRNKLFLAGGIIAAVVVGAALAGGSNNHANDFDNNRNDPR